MFGSYTFTLVFFLTFMTASVALAQTDLIDISQNVSEEIKNIHQKKFELTKALGDLNNHYKIKNISINQKYNGFDLDRKRSDIERYEELKKSRNDYLNQVHDYQNEIQQLDIRYKEIKKLQALAEGKPLEQELPKNQCKPYSKNFSECMRNHERERVVFLNKREGIFPSGFSDEIGLLMINSGCMECHQANEIKTSVTGMRYPAFKEISEKYKGMGSAEIDLYETLKKSNMKYVRVYGSNKIDGHPPFYMEDNDFRRAIKSIVQLGN